MVYGPGHSLWWANRVKKTAGMRNVLGFWPNRASSCCFPQQLRRFDVVVARFMLEQKRREFHKQTLALTVVGPCDLRALPERAEQNTRVGDQIDDYLVCATLVSVYIWANRAFQ